MSARHLASFALIGVMGRRVGTRFVFKPEEIDAVHGNPYFKWRNDDARHVYREWKQSQTNHDDGVCEDCPPVGYPTDGTRCWACPRK